MRAKLADELIRNYQESQLAPERKKRCFIGFDGVTDEIITAIATKRKDANIPFKTISSFGERIIEASGKSCNVELIVRLTKIGGNAPILTDALLKGAHLITFAGTIGEKGRIEALFKDMAEACEEVFPLGPSAHSDAIEFDDGKIILGKLENFKIIDYDHLLGVAGKEKFKEVLDRSDLFISANWTMLPTTNDLWRRILKEIFPLRKKPRLLFIDLADPAKRTDEDLQEALHLLKEFTQTYQVILGLNEAEAMRIASILDLPTLGESKENIIKTAESIQAKSALSQVVIHATRFACTATADGSWIVDGPYTTEPFMTTGAGDNFNAGYCNALLYGLTIEQALLSGVATSGYYVRFGKSPSMEELADFLRKWG